VELEGKKIRDSEDIENVPAPMGGAGIAAAQLVADREVKAVITGNMGPRAFNVFQQLGIEVYQGAGKIREAVEKLANGKLKRMEKATRPMFIGNDRRN